MYDRLPDPPVPDPAGETAIVYGCRVLYFLLETGVYCTCTDDQLRAAEHASRVAVTAREILPAAVDRLSAVRHEISSTLRRRAALTAEQTAQQPAGCTIGSPGSDSPDDPSGRVPRRPYPIAPAPGDRLPVPVPVFDF